MGTQIFDENNVVGVNRGLHPIVGYNFMLRVEALFDLPCRSVKALSRELEFDYIQEGGLNDYVHMLRKPISKPFTLRVERYIGLDIVDPMPLGAELALPVMLFVSRTPIRSSGDAASCERTFVFTGCTVIAKDYGEMDAEHSNLIVETTTIAYREMACVDLSLVMPYSEDEVPYTAPEAVRASVSADTLADYKRRSQALTGKTTQSAAEAQTYYNDAVKIANSLDKALTDLDKQTGIYNTALTTLKGKTPTCESELQAAEKDIPLKKKKLEETREILEKAKEKYRTVQEKARKELLNAREEARKKAQEAAQERARRQRQEALKTEAQRKAEQEKRDADHRQRLADKEKRDAELNKKVAALDALGPEKTKLDAEKSALDTREKARADRSTARDSAAAARAQAEKEDAANASKFTATDLANRKKARDSAAKEAQREQTADEAEAKTDAADRSKNETALRELASKRSTAQSELAGAQKQQADSQAELQTLTGGDQALRDREQAKLNAAQKLLGQKQAELEQLDAEEKKLSGETGRLDSRQKARDERAAAREKAAADREKENTDDQAEGQKLSADDLKKRRAARSKEEKAAQREADKDAAEAKTDAGLLEKNTAAQEKLTADTEKAAGEVDALRAKNKSADDTFNQLEDEYRKADTKTSAQSPSEAEAAEPEPTASAATNKELEDSKKSVDTAQKNFDEALKQKTAGDETLKTKKQAMDANTRDTQDCQKKIALNGSRHQVLADAISGRENQLKEAKEQYDQIKDIVSTGDTNNKTVQSSTELDDAKEPFLVVDRSANEVGKIRSALRNTRDYYQSCIPADLDLKAQ